MQSRNAYQEKLEAVRSNTTRVEEIVQQKVNVALATERQQMSALKQAHEDLQRKLAAMETQNQDLATKNKQLIEELQSLRSHYEAFAQNSETKELVDRMNKMRAERDSMEKANAQTMAEYNKLANLIEDFTAENRTLRQMVGAPDNFGIDIEKIKLLNREKVEDFRKLIKILQDDNYKLEEERAKLKHALKIEQMRHEGGDPSQYFKSLTRDQIASVNQFA